MLNTVTTSASALLLALLGGNLGPALPEAGAAEPAPQDADTAAVAQESVPADDALADGADIDASTPEVVESRVLRLRHRRGRIPGVVRRRRILRARDPDLRSGPARRPGRRDRRGRRYHRQVRRRLLRRDQAGHRGPARRAGQVGHTPSAGSPHTPRFQPGRHMGTLPWRPGFLRALEYEACLTRKLHRKTTAWSGSTWR